jgi:hypothetical protein
MWSRKQNHERDLRSLLARVEAADEIRADLISDIQRLACPRLETSFGPNDEARRLIEVGAWVELGIWLIGWELPDWGIHRLTCDDSRWCCSIGVRGIAINWVEDIVEFQHDSLPLAVLGAFVKAQLRKAQGRTPSNVTPFRRMELARPPIEPAKPLHTGR